MKNVLLKWTKEKNYKRLDNILGESLEESKKTNVTLQEQANRYKGQLEGTEDEYCLYKYLNNCISIPTQGIIEMKNETRDECTEN